MGQPSTYNPGGETTMGLNNSGISDSGHGYFINKEAEAAHLKAASDLASKQAKERGALQQKHEQELKDNSSDQVTDGKGSGTGHDAKDSED